MRTPITIPEFARRTGLALDVAERFVRDGWIADRLVQIDGATHILVDEVFGEIWCPPKPRGEEPR